MKTDKAPRFETPVFVLLVAGLGFFLLSFIAMGLAPWTSLRHVIQPRKLSSNPYVDKSGNPTAIGRGRQTYIQEGCWHCHSQFVRPIGGEEKRYGPVSKAWDSMYDVPQTYGTRRLGPDLSREAGRRPDDWHFAHLYNPRNTVPLSIMPSYPYFFVKTFKGPAPTEKAKDLVAYLQYLGRDYEGIVHQMFFPDTVVVPPPPQVSVQQPDGQVLYREHCSGCHGVERDGQGPAYRFLWPSGANLSARYISEYEIYRIMLQGISGTSMPSFGDFPPNDLWAIARYLQRESSPVLNAALSGTARELLPRGKEIYDQQCKLCHGASGRGDGPSGKMLKPGPKDFSIRVFSPAYVNLVLDLGRLGTSMPSFPGMTDRDKKAIASYLTSFYNRK